MRKKLLMTASAVAVMIHSSSPGYAQSVFMGPLTENEISIEYLKPKLKGSGEVSGYFARLSGRVRLTDRLLLLMDIPYARGAFNLSFQFFGQQFDVSESHTTVGNIRLGLEIHSFSEGLTFHAGTRLPTVSQGATWAQVVGISSDVDELDGFIPNILPIDGAANYVFRSEEGLRIDARVGSSFWIKTKSVEDDPAISDDTETLAGSSMLVGYERSEFFARIGYAMRMVLTEGGDLDQRTYQQIGGVLGARIGFVRLSGVYRWHIDKTAKNAADYIYGFQATAEF
ncbi:MAG: hypothetical protein HYY49_07750 [Ignavibacteriales bacterium]|nr:hypothetical protein [Ignavibacteriales bacterium]